MLDRDSASRDDEPEVVSGLAAWREAWDRVTPLQLGVALSAISLIVMVVGVVAAFSDNTPLPPPRDPPPLPEEAAVSSYRYKEGFYRAQVDEDCREYKLRCPNFAELKKAHAYALELEKPRRLAVGEKLETSSLELRALKKKLWVGDEGQGMRAPHLVLRIINRTDDHVAYRVVTGLNKSCGQMAAIAHNAIALRPKEQVLRSECLLSASNRLTVERVEVLRLNTLGHAYASRLDPLRLQLIERTSAGHNFADLPPCKLLPWREIRDSLEAEETTWRDVIDFYARHNCDEYSFFRDYRWAKAALPALPVKPPVPGAE